MVTPSTVSAVSATLVASTTRRRGPRAQRALLLVERLVAVQRHDVDVAQRRPSASAGAADLAGAGQEDEHVARSLAQHVAHDRRDVLREPRARRQRRPVDRRRDARGPPT